MAVPPNMMISARPRFPHRAINPSGFISASLATTPPGMMFLMRPAASSEVSRERIERALDYVEQLIERRGPVFEPIAERLRQELAMRSNTRPDPVAYPPRGLSREGAARWIGVSTTKFDQMVKSGQMPKPKKIGGRRIWDRYVLDAAFSDLDHNTENKIDKLLGLGKR